MKRFFVFTSLGDQTRSRGAFDLAGDFDTFAEADTHGRSFAPEMQVDILDTREGTLHSTIRRTGKNYRLFQWQAHCHFVEV